MDEPGGVRPTWAILVAVARHRWDPVAARVPVVHPRRVGPGLTADQARGGRWRRTGSGLHVPSDVDGQVPQQRVVEVAATLPPGGAVTGWAACLLAGAAWFDGVGRDGTTPLPVPVAVGHRGGVRRRPEIRVSFERLPEWEVWTRYGVRAARPERAVFDEMRAHGEREALVVLESALAGRLTSLPRMVAYAAARRSARRRGVADWALARARGGARSPLEVRVRTLAEEDARWAPMEVNVMVEDLAGRRIGEVDAIDVEAGAVIEVDGADHRQAAQQTWDISKEEHLRRVGLEVTRVTCAHTRDPGALVERLRSVRGRARFAAPHERQWRLRPPALDLEAWLAEREATALWAEHLALPRSA